MNYQMTDSKWNSVRWFFDRLWEAPDAFPDKGVLLALSEDEVKGLFIESRVILLQALLRAKRPVSLSKLAGSLERAPDSVLGDLELLEKFSVTERDERGNWKANGAILLPEIAWKIRCVAEGAPVPSFTGD